MLRTRYCPSHILLHRWFWYLSRNGHVSRSGAPSSSGLRGRRGRLWGAGRDGTAAGKAAGGGPATPICCSGDDAGLPGVWSEEEDDGAAAGGRSVSGVGLPCGCGEGSRTLLRPPREVFGGGLLRWKFGSRLHRVPTERQGPWGCAGGGQLVSWWVFGGCCAGLLSTNHRRSSGIVPECSPKSSSWAAVVVSVSNIGGEVRGVV
jgi:hypothetical protein